MGSEREARENLVKRQRDHALKTTGRMPSSKDVQRMEKEATDAARRYEWKQKERKG